MDMSQTPPSDLAGLLVDEAQGRIAAARTELAAGVVDSAAGRRLAEALHSLKGLLAQTGSSDLAERVHAMEARLPEAKRAAGRTQLLDELRQVRELLVARIDVTDRHRLVSSRDVVDTLVAEAERVAGRRRVALRTVVDDGPWPMLPRRVAGVLADAAGHVVRNAVVHGGRGGSVEVRFALRADRLGVGLEIADVPSGARVVTGEDPDLDSGRGVGRTAAAGRLAEIDGTVTESRRSDGGLAVTLHVPSGSSANEH
jgi:signal transduction histidine kinase